MLHCAAMNGHAEVAKMVLQDPRFTDLNAKDEVNRKNDVFLILQYLIVAFLQFYL